MPDYIANMKAMPIRVDHAARHRQLAEHENPAAILGSDDPWLVKES
jgi:hypothetical protein